MKALRPSLFSISVLESQENCHSSFNSRSIYCNTVVLAFLEFNVLKFPTPPSSSFAGILACLDGYMNIAMEQTEEYVNGQLKNKYGDAFIRGNNGNYNLDLIFYFTFFFFFFNNLYICDGNDGEFHYTCAVLYISTSKRTLADGA